MPDHCSPALNALGLTLDSPRKLSSGRAHTLVAAALDGIERAEYAVQLLFVRVEGRVGGCVRELRDVLERILALKVRGGRKVGGGVDDDSCRDAAVGRDVVVEMRREREAAARS